MCQLINQKGMKMKSKKVSVFFVFILVIMSLECINKATDDISNVQDILKIIPESCIERSQDSELLISCIEVMRNDEDLKRYYKGLSKDATKYGVGIDNEDIVYFCFTQEFELRIFSGNFYLEGCRYALESYGYYRTKDYLEVEIWKGKEESVGIISDNLIVYGSDADVMDIIEVIRGHRLSIYESNESLRKLVNQLLKGEYIDLYLATGPRSIEGEPFPKICVGLTKKVDKETIEKRMLCEYYSEEDAKIRFEEYLEDNHEEILEDGFDVDISQSGKIIELKIKYYIEDYA